MSKQISEQVNANRIYLRALREARRNNFDKQSVGLKLRNASALGSAAATYALATWYLHGEHFEKNLRIGTVLLKRAARQGEPSACFDLAVSFEKGVVVSRDREKAFLLYMEAAMRGDIDSNREVARCLWHGIGTKKNRVLAHLWGDKFKAASRKKRGRHLSSLSRR